jgi:glyoxylase-like metal-dependent hydrolase (beta-lactamase superfamily II)
MAFSIKYACLGSIGTNCYILKNDETGEGVLIDVADDLDGAVAFVERSNIKLTAILLTHGHYDHATAARELADRYGVKFYASENEKNTLASPDINLSSHMGRVNVSISADYWVKDGEVLSLAGIDIKAIHTPGHTEGGMSYFVQTDTGSVLFSGDTLFAESVGRTDFPTGSMSQIVASVKQKLFALPDSTVVYPGHGEGTSIGHEKKYNPFCQ